MKKYKKSFKTRKKTSYLKIFKTKFFWLGLFFLIFVCGISYFLFFSGVFEIKEIRVSGTEKIPEQEVREMVERSISKNIILANLEEAKEVISNRYIEINRIEIKRKWPRSVLVEIEERKPVLVLREDSFPAEEYYLIDREGMIFERTLSLPENIAEIEKPGEKGDLGKTVLEKPEIEKILEIKEGLKTPLERIVLVSRKKVEIRTVEGWKAYFNFEKDISWQLEQLKIILEEKIPEDVRNKVEYIDLRFNKIYIFPELE